MKTKRLILMLLVALMSVTGAWAQTIISGIGNYERALSDRNTSGEGWLTNATESWIIVAFPNEEPSYIKKYSLYPFYHFHYLDTETKYERWYEVKYTPDVSKLEGSNDKINWTVLQEGATGMKDRADLPIQNYSSHEVNVNTTKAYKYYKLTIITQKDNTVALNRVSFERWSKPHGSGTAANPYIITNEQEWYMFVDAAQEKKTTCCKLDADITLADSYTTKDFKDYTGTIDGNNHVLKNVPPHGLFSNIGAATVKNLGIEDCAVSSNDAYCGALAAKADRTKCTNCYVVGSITQSDASAICGGLVGMATNNAQLTQCYSVINVDDREIRPTFVSSINTDSYLNLSAHNLVDDGGVETRWIAEQSHKVDGVWNIVVTTGRAILLKSIKLWNADNQTYPGRRWKSMKVYGSASANGEWTEMGAFPNLQLEANNKGLAGEIVINATEEYAYYRIDVLDNEGDNFVQMSDMKFVVVSPTQLLPVCGSSDGSCTATLCYHYGSTPSAMSTPVEKADIASGRLAYLLNNGNITGPFFQAIGKDAYPHLTSTGSNYVYLAMDDATYTNKCPHRDCTVFPFKAPSCLDIRGNVEYGKCTNSLCEKYFLMSDRQVENTDDKYFTLSSKPIVLQEHPSKNIGTWGHSMSKSKENTTYHNVMELQIARGADYKGIYKYSFTMMDDEPTMNLHVFFQSTMEQGEFSVRFFVNETELNDLSINCSNITSELHNIVPISGLHKYDRIYVVFNYGYVNPNGNGVADLFVGTEIPLSHDFIKHELTYNCIDGGYLEHYECIRCTNVFTENTPESDDNITTLSNLALAPKGAHNFETVQMEGNLYRDQCQNQYCTTFDPEKYVLKNYHNDADLPLSYDGTTYTAKAPVSLVDGKTYVTSVAFSATEMEYNRTFYKNVWNAWFVPFTATVEELADNGITDVACIESIHNYDMDEDGVVDKTVLEVILKKAGTMKAGVPYMVKAGEGYTYPMVFTDRILNASTDTKTLHSETISAAYDFIGTYSELTAEDVSAASIFSLNSEGAMVHRTGKILPQRWYMKEVAKENVYEELSPAMARAISIRVIGEEDQETGIRTIYTEDKQTEELLPEGIFDLNGRKLSAPQPGKINIINGKKQYVK